MQPSGAERAQMLEQRSLMASRLPGFGSAALSSWRKDASAVAELAAGCAIGRVREGKSGALRWQAGSARHDESATTRR
jgi:hypothetical protein